MPTALPYVPSYGKIKALFEKVSSAKVPDAFTQTYLAETLGLASSADRPLIPLLRSLGLIDAAGRPSSDYPLLKNAQKAGPTLAAAVRTAYAAVFAANENAHKLNNEELKGLVAQVAGSDDEVTRRTAATFRTLVEIAGAKSFDEQPAHKPEAKEDSATGGDDPPPVKAIPTPIAPLRSEFHYNIQVHLPSNGSEETYLNIFNALRKALS